MGQLLVRNVADETIATIRKLASKHGRSMEAEHRAILDEAAAAASNVSDAKAVWIARLRQSREETRGRTFTPSEVLVREMREER